MRLTLGNLTNAHEPFSLRLNISLFARALWERFPRFVRFPAGVDRRPTPAVCACSRQGPVEPVMPRNAEDRA